MNQNERKRDFNELSNMLVEALDIPDEEKAKMLEHETEDDTELINESAHIEESTNRELVEGDYQEIVASLKALDTIEFKKGLEPDQI